MWIVKGSLLGSLLFVVGCVVFLVAWISHGNAKAIGITVIQGLTIHNPLFWMALAGSLMIGCAIVGSWPSHP